MIIREESMISKSLEEYLKTMSGMVKFVCNNKQGVFDFNNSSVFLGVTRELIEYTLELFEEAGIIQITERQEACYILSNFNHVSNVKFEDLSSYALFCQEYSDIAGFKESCQSVDIDKISVYTV